MSNTKENRLPLVNAVKSRKIRVFSLIVIVISIVVSAVLFKSGVVLRPNTFGFIKKWLSPPYIYLVLNLVIILIYASPRLLHSLLWIFNYFKEAKIGHDDGATSIRDDNASKPSSPSLSVVATTTTSSDHHFYQDWQDFIHGQSPTSLSSYVEREPFDEPWPDIINTVASSIKATNSFDGREGVEGRNFIKKVKKRGGTSPLHLPSNEIKNKPKFDENSSLKSGNSITAAEQTNGREKLVSSIHLIGNSITVDDALEGTRKTITKGDDIIFSPSLITSKGGGACILKEKEDTLPPLHLIGTKNNNYACEADEDETIDSTWKAIMEGRETVSPSLSLNTTESERINVPSRLISPRIPRQDALTAWRELRKSETFNETVSARQIAGLRRDPSLSLDDLNCRVESFIKNFNHQMLLQRQESEQRFSEMINSGGY